MRDGTDGSGIKDKWSMTHSKYATDYVPQSDLPYYMTTPRRLSTFEPLIRSCVTISSDSYT